MSEKIDRILRTLEQKFASGARVDGPRLVREPLGGDLSIAGYRDRQAKRPAAVLIPLTAAPRGLNIIFTERPETMKEHPGQISFPGGRTGKRDHSAVATALREAQEEIGLPPDLVRIVGELSPYKTITDYHITPVIGLVHKKFIPSPDEREVAEAFEAPLAFFLDARNATRHTRLHEGRERAYYAFDFQGRFIWGATAAMLINLREALVAFARE